MKLPKIQNHNANCCVILYGTLTLALLILLTKMSLPGLLVWNEIIGRVWKYIFHSSPRGNADHPSLRQPVLSQTDPLEEDYEENECQPQELVDEEEGTTVQQRDVQLGQPPGGTSSSTSIRRLLCDKAACALCERTAMEAAEVVRILRKAPRIPPLLQPPLPAFSYVERSSLPAVSALRGSAPFSPVSTSEPLASCTWQPPLRQEGQKEKLSHPPPQSVLIFRAWDRSPHPQSQPAQKEEENSDSSEDNREQEEEEHFLISTSGTSMLAVTSGGDSRPSSCLTGSSSCSWKDGTHFRHHKTSLGQQDQEEVSSLSDSDRSLESQDEDHRDKSLLQKPEKHLLHLSREASAVTSSGRLQSQRSAFAAVNIPFVTDATQETLEWHMVMKRVQHGLGLPLLLLRSLRAFQPLAPNHTFQPPPKKEEAVVVTQLQELLFLSEEVRSRLEHHVRKRVHLERWGLPRKVQRALGHMKLDPQPPAWRERPAFRDKGRAGEKGQRAGKLGQQAQRLASAAPGKVASKSPPLCFKAKLQIHVGKKFLEIGQEAFPKRVRDSQKITAPEERKLPLPKVIRPDRGYVRRRNGPSLGLRRKADRVDMNTKCKHIQSLQEHPSMHSQSLSEAGTSSLELPVAPPRVHPTIEFGEAETPFLPHYVQQHLEAHVIRKKIHHQWGQPRLMQQSVEMFLPAAPSAAAPRSVSTIGFQVEVKVVPNSSLPFISLEARRHLDDHIKSKIVERRWGIPKRVMESLQKFMPFSISLTRKSRGSQKTSVSLEEEKLMKKPPSRETPNLFGKRHIEQSKYSSLRRHVAKKALEIQMELVDSLFHLSQATGNQMRKQHGLPKVIPLGLKAQQPRCQELAFVEAAVLVRIEFNIIHKNVTARLGLPTLYRKSLSCLFKDVKFQLCCPPIPSKGTTFDFTSTETAFLDRGMRAELEWHVRRKKLQHTWGMPILVQKSLCCLFPTLPNVKTPGYLDVTVLPAQLSFLSHTTIQELERNVAKRAIHQQWCLPRRVLGSLRLLCPEMVSTEGPQLESRKPRALVTSSPCQPQVLLKLQPEVLDKMMLHLDKKHIEVCLGAIPAMARFSWQCASLFLKEPLPKLIPPRHRTQQKRSHFLPFGHPEDLDNIELSLRHNHLKSLWGLGTHYTEAVRRLVPRAPALRRRATAFPFSEVKLPFLQEQEREDLEFHIRRKRLEHQWGFPVLIQRSLRGFAGEIPSPLPHWKTLEVDVHILCQELSFVSQGTRSYLEFHIQGMKQKHQWGLPRRVVESLRAMSPSSVSGLQGVPHILPPFIQMKDGDSTKPDLQEIRAGFDFSEAQILFLSNKDREGLELHIKKKRIQREWSLPGLVKRSLESFMHGAPSLHRLQKARIHIQPKPEELSFLPAGVCVFLEQHIQSMKHRQQWHLPKRILQFLRPLGWQLEAGIPGEKRTRAPHPSPERSCEEPSEELDGRRTTAYPPSKTCLLLTQRSKAQQKMQVLLLKKCVEVQTAAFPAFARQSWLSVSLRQPLPKPVSSRAPPCPRSNFLPFVRREELLQIELAVLRNHFTSLWGLGRSYAGAASALMGKPTPKPLSFKDIHVEFLEQPIPFLQDQAREGLERHVRKKRLEHVWGFPGLFLKSLNGFIQSAPPQPSLRKTEIHVHVLRQEPSFLLQSICCRLEFHLQRMQVQRQWRLPERVLKSTRLFLSPQFWTQSSDMTRTRYGHWAASEPLPGYPERGSDKNLLSILGPKIASKLQLHLAKKSTEVQLQAVPGVVRHSWTQMPLFSKQHLPKVIRPGFTLQQSRSASFPFFHSGEAGQIDMAIRRAHLASLWGLGTRYMEALSGMIEGKPFSEHVGLRWIKTEFVEAQTPFLQEHQRELLEAHVTKKKIHHTWGFPVLIQKSLKVFMQETPQLSLSKKTRIHVHILRQDPLFLPQEISRRFEFHIQKRKLQRQWGLPRQVLASLKVFFPVGFLNKAPLSFTKELRDESPERGEEEEIGQRWRMVVDAFSSEQKSAMQKHFDRKHFGVHQEMEPKLVRQSQEKARGLGKDLGQKRLPERAEASAFLPFSTPNDLELNVPYKQWTSAWGQTSKSLEPQFEITSETHTLIPARRWSLCVQEVETPYLQSEQREVLEYHLKNKRLQHEWGLPGAVQRSVQTLAPSLLVPTCPSQGRGQEVRIQTKQPSFLPTLFRKTLEDSLKKMIIHRQWGLPKRIRDSLRMFSPAVGKALEAVKESRENILVEEVFYLSGENQQATEGVKESPKEVRVSGLQSPRTSRAGSISCERPETLKQVSFSTGHSEMEGIAITGKTPTTTKEEEEGVASMAGLQSTGNVACEMPQATEEVAFADGSQEDTDYETVDFRNLETSLGMEVASEIPLTADVTTSLTQITPGAVATFAVTGQSPLSAHGTVEGPLPTAKVINDSKMSLSVEDTNPPSESLQMAKENNLVSKSIEKEEQTAEESFLATEEGNVADSPQAREEGNIPGPQSKQTMQDESSSRPHAPHLTKEENTPGQQKKPPTYQNELKLWVGHGGRIGTWVSSEKPPSSTSLQPPPSMEIPEGGGTWERSTARAHPRQGRASPDKPAHRSAVHSCLQKVALEEGLEALPESLDKENMQRCPLLPREYSWNAHSPRGSQMTESLEHSSAERGRQPTANSSFEKLLWDKVKISQQLESSLQGMFPENHCLVTFPRCFRKPYSPHPVVPREPFSADHSHVISSPCWCHTATYQRGLAFPCEEDESQEDSPVSTAESTTDAILARPESTQENLFRSCKVAANYRTQRAFGLFRPSPHLISPYSGYKETVPELTSQAGRRSWKRQSRPFHQGSTHLQEEDEETPLQIQGHRDHFDDRRWQKSVAGHAGEPRDWVGESPSEVSLDWELASSDLGMNGAPVEKQSHESSWTTEKGQKASGVDSEASGKSSQQCSPLGFSLDDLPAPTSDCFESEAEDEAVKIDSKSSHDSHVVGFKKTSQPHLDNFLKECHVPVEDEDQFSTECEWERIGDWDSDHIQPHSMAISAKEEESAVWERPTGCCPKTGALLGSKGQDVSSSTGQNADNMVCLIGSVLERKLSLNQGMHLWMQSQGRGRVPRCEKSRERALTLASHKEDQNMSGRPTRGHCTKAETLYRSQGEDVSSNTSQDPDKIVTLIGSVVERKLSLKHGMHLWLQSQGKGRVARCEKSREGASTVASHEEEMQERKPFRAAFVPDVESAVERGVPERWVKPVQTDRETHQPTGAPFPETQPFLRERRGPSDRPGIFTSPDSTQKTSEGNHSGKHGNTRPDDKFSRDGCQSKASGMKSGTGGVRRQEAHCLDRPAERRPGSQKETPNSRKWKASTSQGEIAKKEERLSSSQKESLNIEMSAFSSEQWSPTGSQEKPQTRVQGSQRRGKESMVRVRFTDQCSPLVKERNAQQEDVHTLTSEQAQTTVKASRKRSTFFKSDLLKLLHHQDHQTMAGNRHRGQEMHRAAWGQDLPRGHHHGPASATHHVPLPSEDQFHSLKGRILSRRRELRAPSDDEEKTSV